MGKLLDKQFIKILAQVKKQLLLKKLRQRRWRQRNKAQYISFKVSWMMAHVLPNSFNQAMKLIRSKLTLLAHTLFWSLKASSNDLSKTVLFAIFNIILYQYDCFSSHFIHYTNFFHNYCSSDCANVSFILSYESCNKIQS